MTKDGAILRLERERDFSRKMEKSWSKVDWKNRPDHLADPRALSENHRMYAEALDMAISALREQPRWISVEERLPEPEVSGVLIWCGSYIELGWYDNEDGVWRSDLVNDYEGDVTHWMPLPEPPKEEESDD